ncbi:MAG: hypothetical protein ABJA82_00550 [Myxococcales bacterium]
MNIKLLSQILTFASGVCATIAGYGVAGAESGIPKWLILTCIALTGGFAKASIGALPITGPSVGEEKKPASGQ